MIFLRPSLAFAIHVFLLCGFLLLAPRAQPQEKEQVKGVPAEPVDAPEVREQIAILEKLKPLVPDRAAVLCLLSAAKQHLGESLEAFTFLKECLAMREGFDPSGDPAFLGLKGSKEFDDLVSKVHQEFL